MSSYLGIILAVVLILIWLVAGGYITQANIKIRGFEGDDVFFRKANNYAFWAAFITWFLVALFILLIILAVVGVVGLFSTGVGEAAEVGEAGEAAEEESSASKLYKQYQNTQGNQDQGGISWSTIIFLFFATVLVSITGVLAALAADQLKQSHLFMESNADMKTAYDDCVITAIICLGSVGLLVLGVIFYLFIGFFESDPAVSNTDNNAPGYNNISNVPTNNNNNNYNQSQIDLANKFVKGTLIKK